MRLPKKFLVKFTHSYGEEAHRACTKFGIAPKLSACEDLTGGWKAVVMAAKTCFTLSECILDVEYKAAVKIAMETAKKMHSMWFVHGNLHGTDILYPKTLSARRNWILSAGTRAGKSRRY